MAKNKLEQYIFPRILLLVLKNCSRLSTRSFDVMPARACYIEGSSCFFFDFTINKENPSPNYLILWGRLVKSLQLSELTFWCRKYRWVIATTIPAYFPANLLYDSNGQQTTWLKSCRFRKTNILFYWSCSPTCLLEHKIIWLMYYSSNYLPS